MDVRHYLFYKPGASVLSLLIMMAGLAGCAGSLQPVQTPVEVTPPPATSPLWDELSELRQDDWFYLLNLGNEALDWRLRAIDSAVDSIDLQTFIWALDGSGNAIRVVDAVRCLSLHILPLPYVLAGAANTNGPD